MASHRYQWIAADRLNSADPRNGFGLNKSLGITGWRDADCLNHQDDGTFWCAGAMNNTLWDDIALPGL
jgi:hypothetical protein